MGAKLVRGRKREDSFVDEKACGRSCRTRGASSEGVLDAMIEVMREGLREVDGIW
jgi:hypothetical protein